ncbi:MAG: RimK family protein [Nitrospinae bacterium]|nr:RimK family protein [Nitrospinota bacterium]
MKHLIVTENPDNFLQSIPDAITVSAKRYLTKNEWVGERHVYVYNLCRSYRFQSMGYYVSLLAEARDHKVIPNVTTTQDFKASSVVKVMSKELDELMQKSFSRLHSDEFVLSIYFGKNLAECHERLAKKLFELFQAPLLRAHFVFNGKWQLQNIAPIPLKEVPSGHLSVVCDFACDYFGKRQKRTSSKKNKVAYDMAILVNPREKAPPSNEKALKLFVKAAAACRIECEFITSDSFNRIPEFDALFIRETTAVNHYTYRFSRRAAAEGLVVIDDPQSILKCANKVYLAELLARAKVPTPKTIVVSKENLNEVTHQIPFPCIVKDPAGSFSIGVYKVTTIGELKDCLKKLFEKTELAIVQEFLPTDYDWRIGFIGKFPLFACKYYMAKGHWQIYNWNASQKNIEGKSQTLPVELVPDSVLKVAKKAADLIGDGFYGVDLKQVGKQVYVIEVNDNPNVDVGVEDAYLKGDLYRFIMRHFLKRLEAQHQN